MIGLWLMLPSVVVKLFWVFNWHILSYFNFSFLSPSPPLSLPLPPLYPSLPPSLPLFLSPSLPTLILCGWLCISPPCDLTFWTFMTTSVYIRVHSISTHSTDMHNSQLHVQPVIVCLLLWAHAMATGPRYTFKVLLYWFMCVCVYTCSLAVNWCHVSLSTWVWI